MKSTFLTGDRQKLEVPIMTTQALAQIADDSQVLCRNSVDSSLGQTALAKELS